MKEYNVLGSQGWLNFVNNFCQVESERGLNNSPGAGTNYHLKTDAPLVEGDLINVQIEDRGRYTSSEIIVKMTYRVVRHDDFLKVIIADK